MKIILNKNQKDLLYKSGITFEENLDYDDDLLVQLEDSITEYVLEYAMDSEQNVTDYGDRLLELHDFIVKNYDR